jgi:CubicO group peptidase (beta-lactamase class C family)
MEKSMQWLRKVVPGILFLLACTAHGQEAAAWPMPEWTVAEPESVGLDSNQLRNVLEMVRDHDWRVDSIQVVRHGKLVVDAYYYPYSPGLLHDLRSVTKSVTSSLLGLSIAQGRLPGVEAPVLGLFPGRPFAAVDAAKRAMTLGNLVDMRSGLSWSEIYSADAKSSFEQMRKTVDWVGFVLDQPMACAPGSRFTYSGGNMNVLAAVVGGAWRRPARDVAREQLFQPIGIARSAWLGSDPVGNTIGESNLYLDPRDMARLGLFWLHDGVWRNQALLPKGWTGNLLGDALPTLGKLFYRRGFWVQNGKRAFMALGRHGQAIMVDPALDLVVVVTGKIADQDYVPSSVVFDDIRECAAGTPALPENPTAQSALQAELRTIAQPPQDPAEPVVIPAGRIGRTWKLEANPFHFASLRLAANPADAGSLFLELTRSPGDPEQLPCGMDGAYRFNPRKDRHGFGSALKGSWTSPDLLEVQYQTLEASAYWTFQIAFQGDRVTISYEDNEYSLGTIHSTDGSPGN